jgi:hypothetical protein
VPTTVGPRALFNGSGRLTSLWPRAVATCFGVLTKFSIRRA